MVAQMRIYFIKLMALLILNSSIFAQDSLDLKNDNAQADEDGSVTIKVLKNDGLKDKSNLILEIVEKPKFGIAAIDGLSIKYTPEPDKNGVDNFKYKVDIGTASGIAQVKVNVNPINDPPIGISIDKNSIAENTPAGTIIGKLRVVDPDEKDSHKFSLSRDDKPNFSLDGSNLLSKRPYDYEEKSYYSVSIQVADSEKESIVGTVDIKVEDVNEAPVLVSKTNMKVKHPEDAGKIVARIEAEDLDSGQDNVKYKLTKGDDARAFKITSRGDLAFLKLPDFEKPLDNDKNNIYEVSYRAIDSKDKDLTVSGSITVTVMDMVEKEVKPMDKRKFLAWNVDHQPYHILMEDAIDDYIKMNYTEDDTRVTGIEEEDGTGIVEMEQTDQVIIIQQKGNANEIHEIWYGNGLNYTVIDREKVDWIFSQDIQEVLIDRNQYLTSDSETVFHKNEKERLMAGYGSQFSVWHANNFKISLSTLSIRSNMIQYATNMRVGNSLIGLPGLLAGASEFGIATQRSEFGLRVPFAFDLASTGYGSVDVPTADYLGLYARGNIDNLFSTKTNFHGLFGFTFYPSSSGEKLNSLDGLGGDQSTILDSTENLNILDSYALAATTVQVPIKLPFIGRLTASPGFHYMKVAHRLKDKRTQAVSSGQEMYERTFYQNSVLNEGNSFTRLNSFYIRFDLLGTIGEKPNFIEKLSLFDFINISNVPFYELSIQYISELNMVTTLNLNISDDIGISFKSLSRNSNLPGNWMPESKIWFGLNYRANF